jgi:hypothetical protein
MTRKKWISPRQVVEGALPAAVAPSSSSFNSSSDNDDDQGGDDDGDGWADDLPDSRSRQSLEALAAAVRPVNRSVAHADGGGHGEGGGGHGEGGDGHGEGRGMGRGVRMMAVGVASSGTSLLTFVLSQVKRDDESGRFVYHYI